MKSILYFLLAISIPVCVTAQNTQDPERYKLRRGIFSNNPLELTEVEFDLHFLQTEIENKPTFGGGFTMGVTFNDFWMVGFNVNGVSNSRTFIDTDPQAVTPAFRKTFWGFHNEIMIAKNRIVNLSFPLRVGFTTFSYKDRYVTWEGREPTLLRDNTLTAEGGVQAFLNLSSYVSLGGGAIFRRYNERGNFTQHIDRDYIFYSVNLRISLPRQIFEEYED